MSDNKVVKQLKRENGLRSNSLNCIDVDLYGNVWVGANNALSKYDGRKVINYTTDDGLPSNNIRDIISDDRGFIQMLVNTPIKNVTLIKSNKGAVRANHYHKTDWHYMYMFEGESDYYYRPAESQEDPKVIVWRKGQLIFTPPMEEHTTDFTKERLILYLSAVDTNPLVSLGTHEPP